MAGRREADGFDAFVEAHAAALKRHALALTGSSADADDLLQTSLVKLYLAWDRLDSPAAAPAYARTIITRTFVSWTRRLSFRERPSPQLPEPSGRTPGADAGVPERDAMWQALATLAPRRRAVVVLRFYDDLTEAAIAEQLGCSVGTVKSQLSRALVHLRQRLDKEGWT